MRVQSFLRVLRACLVIFVVNTSAGLAVPAPESLRDPAQEARAHTLAREFRCPVCQGQSLDESGAPLAADLRRLIRERIKAGDSDDEIKSYLVARYGDFILMEPPFEISTYFLWLTPVAVLILGTGIAISIVVRARKRPE